RSISLAYSSCYLHYSFLSVFFSRFRYHLHLHSFPTRRSSDLRHLDALVRLELDEFERTGADRVLPHLAGRDMAGIDRRPAGGEQDRKSTRLNSSHQIISYAVFCLKKKKKTQQNNKYKNTKAGE